MYLFSIQPVQATGYSLAIVGATALVGAGEYLRRGQQTHLPLALSVAVARWVRIGWRVGRG